MRRIGIVLALLALACGGGGRGGGRGGKAKGGGGVPAGTSSPPVIVARPTGGGQAIGGNDIVHKLDVYVGECLNKFSPRGRESHARYHQWVDEKAGLTGKENIVYGLYTLNFPASDCVEDIEAQAGVDPDVPDLEAAGKVYGDALTALIPLIDAADRYYNDEDYKDDGFAKGKQLHPQLEKAWEAFEDADERLAASIEVQLDLLDVQLVSTEKLRAPEHARRVMMAAKPMVRMADLMVIGSDGWFVGLDEKGFQKAVDDYTAAVDDLDAYVTARINGDEQSLDSFVDDAHDLATSSKMLKRRVRDHEPFEGMDRDWVGSSSGWMVEGSPDLVVSDYGSLVDDFNYLDGARPKWPAPAGRRRGL